MIRPRVRRNRDKYTSRQTVEVERARAETREVH